MLVDGNASNAKYKLLGGGFSVLALVAFVTVMLYGEGVHSPLRQSSKSKTVAFVLCVFLGFLGAHRYYTGKIGTGILYTLTLGFCGIGVLIDLLRIVTGDFKDHKGKFLSRRTSVL